MVNTPFWQLPLSKLLTQLKQELALAQRAGADLQQLQRGVDARSHSRSDGSLLIV